MKQLSELIVFVMFVLALFFLFDDTPDLWDKLHARAMGAACQVRP